MLRLIAHAARATGPPVLTPAKLGSTHRPTVLVVDDDKAIREIVAEVLRDEGYDVVCAQNGLEALCELGKDHRPDLMLLDLMMPVMSGWEVLEQLESSEELSRIPVIVVSAMSAPGASEHLPKPIDLDRLLATVGRLTA
ncbi:MAG: response regulator [Myxococcota bacterium]|nr:response regulator [Myxococcota bacterium]